MANSQNAFLLTLYLIAQCFTSSKFYSVEGDELEVSQVIQRRRNKNNTVANDTELREVISSTRNDSGND